MDDPASITRARADYRSPRWMPGGHLQTLLPSLLPGRRPPPSQRRVVEVEPGTSVELLLSHPAPGQPPLGTLLLVHGLGGSAASRHPVATAFDALARGWVVARVNLRNCGGTAHLASTLFNALQSDDIGAVLADLEVQALPRPFAVLGFSLGGSTVLRYAGLSEDESAADVFAAVNPPIDLAASARVIERPGNLVFQLGYTRALCRLLEHARETRAVPGPPAHWWRIRSVRRFDELYTVPEAGFDSTDEYYAAASAAQFLGGLRRPTLVIAARNDPIVPVATFEAHRGVSPQLRFLHPAQGGHLGYWTGRSGFWAGSAALDGIADMLHLA